MAQEEIVFGYNEETMKAERIAHAKKGIIAGIVVLALAGLCVLGGVVSSINSKKISTYPTTQAQVLKCETVDATDDDGDVYVDYYELDLEYTVDGKACTSKRKRSEKRLEGAITVYYNPDDPSKVYLEAEAKGEGNVYWYAIGGIVGALGLVVVFGEAKGKGKLH